MNYDIYDRFTMDHFPLRQKMTLTTKIYCSRLYVFIITYEVTVTISVHLFSMYLRSMDK
jgi:hypothetical protein